MSRRGPKLRLGRLRPRLTVTLALVAAVTAVTVALASFLVVRELRLRRATDEAIAQGQFNLAFATDALAGATDAALVAGAEPGAGGGVAGVVQGLQRRGGFEIVAVADGRPFQTSVSLTARSVPDDLLRLADRGRIGAARREVDGHPYVVVGGTVPGGTSLWSFFPLDQVFEDLDDLRLVLTVAALVMVALSAMVGAAAARPLLHPIAIARDAAQRLEAGDLTTRVPEDGSDELAELSRSLNGMAAALERTVAELRHAEAGHRRFVADVSHDLRTPVTALAAAAEFLAPRLPDLPEHARRAGSVMVDEAVRLRLLVEDLMEISRMDAGAAVVEEDLIDLRRLVLGAVEDRGWGGVVVTGELAPAFVDGDRRRLDRVLTNLVDNALRHGAPPVEVSLASRGDEVVLEVRDHGPGIADEHLPHVLERFYKADRARGRTEGSGLGLAIARENVVLHGGSLQVANAPGGGARFVVTLPAAVARPLPSGDVVVTSGPHDRVDHPDVTSERHLR